MYRIFTLLVVVLAPSLATAEEVKIVLWNSEAMFDAGTVNMQAADLQDFGQHFPDPPGPDGGHEWVKLTNDGSDTVDLSGWKLRNKANHTVVLSGSIAAGAERKINLADGQMPLNRGGDEIKLLNPAGDEVDSVEYGAGQVSPGVPIPFAP